MKNDEAIVFDVQRFSLQNGPGIRTTVFVKGCGLRCWWCSNPESQEREIQYMWDQQTCIHCGKCTSNLETLDPLVFCGKIVDTERPIECLRGALRQCGKVMNTEEVLKIICADFAYYKRSGGGVTVSGGECLLRPDFTLNLLEKCKQKGIHTAVDTCLWATEETVARSIHCTDLYLADVKMVDRDMHKAMTGQGNELVLRNLQTILESGKKIWIRIPLVLGVNDTIKNAKETVSLIRGYKNVEYVDILPAHALSQRKYEELGKKWNRPNRPEQKMIDLIASTFEEEGIKTRVMEL